MDLNSLESVILKIRIASTQEETTADPGLSEKIASLWWYTTMRFLSLFTTG